MQDDLWLVLRPFAIADPRSGRRDLRPGTTVSLAGRETTELVRRGYIRMLAPAAPLFAESTPKRRRSMKRSES